MEHFSIAAYTIGKVLLVATFGLATATLLHGGSKSIRGLGYYMGSICLPCLLLTRLIDGISWQLVRHCYWATLLSMLSSGIGFTAASIVKCGVPLQFHGILVLASTFQNALSFPLSMLVSIHGLPWLATEADVTEAETYLFIYNVWSTIGTWGTGGRIVRKYKRIEQEFLEELEARHAVTSPTTMAIPATTEGVGRANAGEAATTTTTATSPKRQEEEDDEEDAGFFNRVKSFYHREIKPSLRPPVVATLLGIIIALTPPLLWIAESGPGKVLRAGLAFVGGVTVPMQLFLLGCNLVFTDDDGQPSASSPTAPGEVTSSATSSTIRLVSPATSCAPEAFPARAAFSSRAPVPLTVISCVTLVRLVIVPCIMFPTLHLLVQTGLAPDSKLFKLVICIEASAPGAIVPSIICALHRYRVRQYTSVLLVEYVCAIFTATVWLTLALWWIG